MLGVVFSDVFYSKVVDDEGESDGSRSVSKEAGSVGSGDVAVGAEVLGKALIGEDAGLRKAVHAFADFGHDVVVVDEGSQLVLLHDVRWDIFDRDADVFVLCHWCAEVEVFYVNGHVFCVGCGDDTVDEEFDGSEVGGWSAYVAIVFDVGRLPW